MASPEHNRASSGAPTSRFAPRSFIPSLVVLAACLAMSVAGWRYTDQLTKELARERFAFRATEISHAIEDRVATYEMALRGGQALFSAVGEVSRAKWNDYVGKLNLLQNYPGIQGMGYAVVVPPGLLKKHVAAIRSEGFPDYTIRPPGARAEYTAIVYLEPFDLRNQRAFGFDMFSESTRRAAMERSRDTGQTTISGHVTLVQETTEGVQAGFLMYLPVYKPGAPVFTGSERRAALRGYVYSPFRMNNFMQGIVGKSIPGLGLEIHDDSTRTGQPLLFRSEDQSASAVSGHRPMFTSIRQVELFGRTWTLTFRSLSGFEATVDRTVPWLVLLGGMIISLLLSLVVLSLANTRARALSLADRMTAKLRESEERTRLLLESTGEPIYGIDTNGLCTFCNPACLRVLGYAKPEDLLGRNMHAVIHHTHVDGSPFDVHDCRIFQTFKKGQGTHVDDEVLWRADGTSFPAEYWSYPQLHDGQVVGAVVAFQDITERRRAEADSAKLAGLVNAASQVSIIATDTEGLITVFNPGAENMLGYSAAEMVGLRTPVDLHLESEVLAYSAELSARLGRTVEGFDVFVALAREGGYDVRQWTYARKDGRHIPVELVITAIRDHHDAILGFLGIGVDISTRIQAEQALTRTEKRFRDLADLSPVGIYETDAEGNCLFVNKRWQEFAGMSLEQALGQGWTGAIHPDDVGTVFSEWLEATQNNRDFSLEYRFLTPAGKTTWLMGSATAYRDETGEVQGFFGSVMDIDKRIAAEAALRQSEAQLAAVLDTAVDPIFIVNQRGQIQSANQAGCRTFGYSLKELVGNNVNMLQPEPYHSQHDGYLERYARTGVPHVLGMGGREVPGKRKDGVIIPLELAVSEVVTTGGDRLFTGILRDISERVRAREALVAVNAELADRQSRLDKDMEAAAEIQRSLLPKERTCSLGVETDFRFMPSATIGGDIFNVVCLGANHTGLYMIDVSGHGVPAALVSVTLAQEMLPSGELLMDKFFDQPRSPEGVLRLLDTAFPLERFDKFFSMFYLLYELESGTLTYCNAGHPAPMLLRAGGGLEFLEEGGTLVGMGLGNTYVQGKVDIGDGDMLLVYTDGVSELENPDGEQFSTERLEKLFRQTQGRSPEQVLQAITGVLQTHADGRPPDDDISLVCARFSRI